MRTSGGVASRALSTLAVITTLLLAFAVASPGRADAAEPPAEPLLRIEAETHAARLNRIGTDAAGRYLVTASSDKTARIWEASSGRLLHILRPPIGPGNEGEIYAVAMSPDGATVAVAGWSGWAWDRTNSIYLFDRATGRLARRIVSAPVSINHLVWSADGRLLAAALQSTEGVRVYRVRDGAEVGGDRTYGDSVYGLDFHHTGRLLAAALDGSLRVYLADERGLTLVRRDRAPAPARPFFARFSPDGTRIAVGYVGIARVDVVASDSLGLLYSADTRAVGPAEFNVVAWSADGAFLYAGGRVVQGATYLVRVWANGGRGPFQDLPAASDSVMDVAPLAAGGFAYVSAAPALGVFDHAGRRRWERPAPIADLRPVRHALRLSSDGTVVDFGYGPDERSAARFDVRDRRLQLDPPPDPRLAGATTGAAGLDLRDWLNSPAPTLNGRRLALDAYEYAFSLAIAPDAQSFALGTVWALRRFDRHGRELWRVPVSGVVWSVNVSADGRVVVAAQGDGTLRWYRMVDGAEILALFPHADRRRWILWSPSGYYDASAGAEDLIGWHVNRGRDSAGDFYPVSRFRGTFYRPDVIAQALGVLDEPTALRRANEDAGRKVQPTEIAKALPPVVQILSPADGAAATTPEVHVRFAVRTAPDAPLLGLRARVNGQAVDLGEARLLAAGASAEAVREVAIPIPPQDSDVMLFAENRHGRSSPAVVHVAWRGPLPAPPAATTSAPPAAAAPGAFSVKPKLYVLAVGVSQYRDASLRLRFPAKDAQDFAQAMARQRGLLYRDVEVKILTDAQASKDEVLDGLDWLRKQVTQKDVGMLFLAGHGVNDANGLYYYLPANADLDRLLRTGVAFSDIKNTLGSLTGKALFFVDTCHSGNVMGDRRRGPPDVTGVVNELASAENGVVVFASSTGRQYSLESVEWNNGAFTKALVEGLLGQAAVGPSGRITHKMLDFYVAERVKTLTRGQQTPVNASPQGVPDFPIALVVP